MKHKKNAFLWQKVQQSRILQRLQRLQSASEVQYHKVRMKSEPTWQEASLELWACTQKLAFLVIMLLGVVWAAKHGYRLARDHYHAKDLPSMDVFAADKIWYTEDNLPDHPALNVVEDNPDYDETDFMRIYDVTPDADGVEPVAPEPVNEARFHPEPGHTYEVEIYCRNGADPKYNMDGYGCAEGVYVQVRLPHKFTGTTWTRKVGSSYLAYDFIGVDIAAENIFPVSANEYVEFWSPDDLRFDYVEGSALYYDADYPDGREINPDWLFAPGGALVNVFMCGGREYAWVVRFRFTVSATTWYPWDALIYNFYD